MESLPPRLAAKYRLERLLGKGGMSRVYLARHLSLDREVAFKWLTRVQDLSLGRFKREAQILAAMKHPNILEIYDAGMEDDVFFLASEVVPGGTLRERIGKSTIGEILGYLEELASALDHAHSRGVIHRDLKPENVFLAGSGATKLADFGLARATEHGGTLTAAGKICGTLAYMSPEQIQGRRLEAASDLYSLGLMAYELIAGAVPFAGPHPIEMAMARLEEPYLPVAATLPQVPSEVDQVLEKALALTAEDRQASCAELAEELRAAIPDSVDPARTPREVWGRGSPPRSSKALDATSALPRFGMETSVSRQGRVARTQHETRVSSASETGRTRLVVPALLAGGALLAGVILIPWWAGSQDIPSTPPSTGPATASAQASTTAPATARPAALDEALIAGLTSIEREMELLDAVKAKLPDDDTMALGAAPDPAVEANIAAALDRLETAIRCMVAFTTDRAEAGLGGSEWRRVGTLLHRLALMSREFRGYSFINPELAAGVGKLRVALETLSKEAGKGKPGPFRRSLHHYVNAKVLESFYWPLDPKQMEIFTRMQLSAYKALDPSGEVPASRRPLWSHRTALLRGAMRPWVQRQLISTPMHEIAAVRDLALSGLRIQAALRAMPEDAVDPADRKAAMGDLSTLLVRLATWSLEGPVRDEKLIRAANEVYEAMRQMTEADPKSLREGEALRQTCEKERIEVPAR